jgi:hypothetical protein
MFWIKLALIIIWFLAGLLLFAKDIIVDFPFLKPILEKFGFLGASTSKSKVVKVAPPVKLVKVINPEPPVKVVKPVKVTKVIKTEPLVKVVKPDPIPEPKEEIIEEDNALENVQIFKKKIKARTTWYASLTEAEKIEFRGYFVDDADTHLVKDLVYKLNGNNDAFFERVFNFIYVYRKLISSSLLQKLTDELLFFAENDPEVQTLIYEAATRVAYYRRKDKAMLAYAENLARLDVALQQGVLKAKGKYVYSFTRLAIILERKGETKEALELVEDALKRQLTDRTKTGYEGRKIRLQKRLTK